MMSVIQRSQRLNVVSIGNTDGLLSSQQNIFISLICLSLYRNKKYPDFTADIVWTMFTFSGALKSVVSLSLVCRSCLLYFELLFNCCFLFLICLIFLGSSNMLFEWWEPPDLSSKVSYILSLFIFWDTRQSRSVNT